MSSEERVKVVFIGGAGRSGSTMLDLILGELPGFVSMGELGSIWDRGIVENQLCGCGSPLRECPFWTAVITQAFGGFEAVDAARLHTLSRQVARLRYVLRLGRDYPASLTRAYDEFTEALRLLYQAIHHVSGGAVVVDSSKNPAYAAVLQRMPLIELSLVHLVRDVRAVAFSWQRKRLRPEIHWEKAYMPRFSLTQSVREWYRHNLGMHILGRANPRSVFVRYEDLARQPRVVVQRLLADLGLPPLPDGFLAEARLALTPSHTVAGNPLRFQRQSLDIRADDEWRAHMVPGDRRFVTALSWPLLLGYGYLRDGR